MAERTLITRITDRLMQPLTPSKDDWTLPLTTGDQLADQVLLSSIVGFEEHFPAKAVAYYLTGSYAEGDPIPTSDIDLLIVVHDLSQGRDMLIRLDSLRALSQNHLDPVMIAEPQLPNAAYVQIAAGLKQGSLLLRGRDVRPGVPTPSPEAFGRWAARKALGLMRQVRSGASLTKDVDVPDPTDEFLGYLPSRTASSGAPRTGEDLKPMAAINMLGVIAVLAIEHSVVAATRPGCVSAAGRLLAEPLATQALSIHNDVRMRWYYQVPAWRARSAASRQVLRWHPLR